MNIIDHIGKVNKYIRNVRDYIGDFLPVNANLPSVNLKNTPNNHVNVTKSGHEISINDNPGEESITLKHKTGSSVKIKPNGDIELDTKGAMVYRAENHVFQGAVEIDGNFFRVNTNGDVSLNSGGNFYSSASGNMSSNVGGSSREFISGSKGTITAGSVSTTAVGGITTSSLSGMNLISKGNMRTSVQGDMTMGTSGSLKMTTGGQMNMSSPNINIGGKSVSVFGATGTIGGANVTFHGGSFTGTTFNGDVDGNLNGVAKWAINSKYSGATQSYTGDDFGGTFLQINHEVGADDMDDYLGSGPNAVIEVKIDEGDEIKNMIDRTSDTGGVTHKPQTLEEIRLSLRDPNNKNNTDYTNTIIGEGRVSPTVFNNAPPSVSRVSGGRVRYPTNGAPPFNVGPPSKPSKGAYEPLEAFDPLLIGPNGTANFTGSTYIAPGVPISTFTRGFSIDQLDTRADKLTFAQYAHIHAVYFYNAFKDNPILDGGYRLVATSGLYVPSANENVTAGGINDMASVGRVVTYQVVDPDGNLDFNKTYQMAMLMRDVPAYSVSLDYDTYDPGNTGNPADVSTGPASSSTRPEVSKKQDSLFGDAAGGYGPSVNSSTSPKSTDRKSAETYVPGTNIPVLDDAGIDDVLTGRDRPDLNPDLTDVPPSVDTSITPKEKQTRLDVYITVVLPEINTKYEYTSAPTTGYTTFNGEKQGSSFMLFDEARDRYNGVVKNLDHTLGGGVRPELQDILAYAGDETGLRVVISSGFRGGSANPSGRHNGDAADILLYDESGRMLTVASAADRLRIEEFTRVYVLKAKSEGFAPNVGWANHLSPQSQWYMNGNAGHYDVSPRGGLYWGNGEVSSGAPQWLRNLMNSIGR